MSVLLSLQVSLPGGPLDGQVARAMLDENVRANPDGSVIAVAASGVAFEVVEDSGTWVRIALEGWVRASAVGRTAAGESLVVIAPGAEDLRSSPTGTTLAQLLEGARLTERGRQDGWVRVRREAWVWKASMTVEEGTPTVLQSAAASWPVSPSPGGRLEVGDRPVTLLAEPDGGPLAVAEPRSSLPILEREGAWVRVSVDGWVFAPEAADSAGISERLEPIAPSQVIADPDRYLGRLVRWELQFISLERAGGVRPEFESGEPFLLTRPTGGEHFFVYVGVPDERVPELERLRPLERLRVTGRVRSGASALTGNPIVDLVGLERVEPPRR